MSEMKRGRRYTRASSRGMTSPSTVNGPGEGKTPDLATAFDPRSKSSAKPAVNRDAPKVPLSGSPETTLRDIEGSSNGETSSNASVTRPTPE